MAVPKNWLHALDMLPHLAACAKERKTITYTELSELIGHPAFFLGQSLDVLRDDILAKHRLPRLDALVVGKESGEEGESFYAEGKGNLSAEDYHELLDFERE